MKIITGLKKTFFLLIACYLLAIIAIWVDGAISSHKTANYAIVLGSKVHPSGEPSARLQARLLRAAELYQNKQVKKIIVSGGTGKEGHDEAVVMQRFLIKQGIAEDHILVDSYGYNTRMTANNARRLVNHKEKRSIIVVSQLYHLSRTKMAFRQAGFYHIGSAYPNYFEWRDIYSSFREVAAWLKYWIISRPECTDLLKQLRLDRADIHYQGCEYHEGGQLRSLQAEYYLSGKQARQIQDELLVPIFGTSKYHRVCCGRSVKSGHALWPYVVDSWVTEEIIWHLEDAKQVYLRVTLYLDDP